MITLWVEEVLIESNLVLDTFFLAYYENFCGCKGEQWKGLCMLFKVHQYFLLHCLETKSMTFSVNLQRHIYRE